MVSKKIKTILNITIGKSARTHVCATNVTNELVQNWTLACTLTPTDNIISDAFALNAKLPTSLPDFVILICSSINPFLTFFNYYIT